jgi:hypothetical protein
VTSRVLTALAVGALLLPATAGADAPDLTGKRLLITCEGMDDPTLPKPWVLEIVFDAGRPGEKIDATLINPPQKEYGLSPEAKYRGTYGIDGRLDMMLYPNKLHTSGVDVTISGNGKVSGRCARGYAFMHLAIGEASGECVDCESTGTWGPGAAAAALVLFIALAAYGKHIEAEKKKEEARQLKPLEVDREDPYHDLPRTGP